MGTPGIDERKTATPGGALPDGSVHAKPGAALSVADYHLAGPDWSRTAVVYQIYPRSFADFDGDGVGDQLLTPDPPTLVS